jgi:HTH-type transcriptional regulator/antitoxin HigA
MKPSSYVFPMLDNGSPKTTGEMIRRELDKRGWLQRDLAFILGIPESSANMLACDKRGVSADMAKALGQVFGIPAETILSIQKSSEVQAELARAKEPKAEIAQKAKLITTYPVREMVKRGWISPDKDSLENEVTRFFGICSIDETPRISHFAKKTSYDELLPEQLAWIFRVRQIAQEMLTAEYSPGAVRNAVKNLSSLLLSAEEARKVPRIMAEAGVRFVIVESLPGAKIDGVCFWLDESSPVIALSLRYDRIDNFWFVLRHECEHVLRLHGQSGFVLDTELEGEKAGVGPGIPDDEKVANEAAAEFCIPQKKLGNFIARKSPFFAERDFLGFSRTLQVHPGIAAGQLQHRTGRYDRFRQYQVKIRSIVAPGAMVDGWGDVAPVGR